MISEQEMKKRPIIFNTENVKAILEGRKTQSRRVIKPQPKNPHDTFYKNGVFTYRDKIAYTGGFYFGEWVHSKAHCQVGDRLWVRERYAFCVVDDYIHRALYVDGNYKDKTADRYDFTKLGRHPSIHMPRWASRITLEITSLRVERLQEISGLDCIREGLLTEDYQTASEIINSFKQLWDSLNAKRGYSWESNPFVWVISFKRVNSSENG